MNGAALITLWNQTQQHIGTNGARVSAGVLLGLYNGDRFPFDLTELRAFDAKNLEAALAVIAADAGSTRMEVHRWLDRITGRSDFGERFEHLAHDFQSFRRGRCKKSELQTVQPARLVVRVAEQGDGA